MLQANHAHKPALWTNMPLSAKQSCSLFFSWPSLCVLGILVATEKMCAHVIHKHRLECSSTYWKHPGLPSWTILRKKSVPLLLLSEANSLFAGYFIKVIWKGLRGGRFHLLYVFPHLKRTIGGVQGHFNSCYIFTTLIIKYLVKTSCSHLTHALSRVFPLKEEV